MKLVIKLFRRRRRRGNKELHFLIRKKGFNNSRYRLNGNIDTNLIACASCYYREFLICDDESSNYICYSFENLKEFKYSLSKIKEFNE